MNFRLCVGNSFLSFFFFITQLLHKNICVCVRTYDWHKHEHSFSHIKVAHWIPQVNERVKEQCLIFLPLLFLSGRVLLLCVTAVMLCLQCINSIADIRMNKCDCKHFYSHPRSPIKYREHFWREKKISKFLEPTLCEHIRYVSKFTHVHCTQMCTFNNMHIQQ